MSLLKGRNYYKPFTYPEFYNKWDKHEKRSLVTIRSSNA